MIDIKIQLIDLQRKQILGTYVYIVIVSFEDVYKKLEVNSAELEDSLNVQTLY